MARYKHIDTRPRFLAVDLQRQLLPGTIEHAVNYLLDRQIDLTGLDAHFISTLGDKIAHIFSQVLFMCDQHGLIGREMFAIDGVKLPSNASKAKSGTRADFKRQADKLENAAKVMLERHRAEDQRSNEPDLQAKEIQRLTRLQNDAAQMRQWLAANPDDRKGIKGAIRKSNRTGNESAKMATSKGVIQGARQR